MPVFLENRPHNVVLVAPSTFETLPEHKFGNCTEFAERAVTASVQGRGPTLETMDVERLEGERQECRRVFHERAGSPERRSEYEPHLGGLECAPEPPDLKHADGGRLPVRYNAETEETPRSALPVSPRDEPLEPVPCLRRRREETGDLLIAQQPKQ